MLEVLNEDYVRTARAKGLRTRAISRGHVLRNALLPIITVIGLQTGLLLSGAVLTEQVFTWNGMGSLLADGVIKKDYPVIQGGVMFLAVVFVLVNLLVDVLYAVIDPRIRCHEAVPQARVGLLTAGDVDDVAEIAPRNSLGREGWRRIRRNPGAVVGGGVILFFIIVALFAPLLAPYSPFDKSWFDQIRRPPSPDRPATTGSASMRPGRDDCSRIIFGPAPRS